MRCEHYGCLIDDVPKPVCRKHDTGGSLWLNVVLLHRWVHTANMASRFSVVPDWLQMVKYDVENIEPVETRTTKWGCFG